MVGVKDVSFSNKLVEIYFDLVYNPIYDLTTAQSSAYRSLQKRCIDKLGFENGDSMLCVGVGTGNEIPYILDRLDGNREFEIVGMDTSEKALKRAYQKGLKRGKEIRVSKMDAQNLQYPAESFDKVLCLHVMDFIEDDGKATREIFRVLREGGEFVITYPSDKEGVKLGINLLKDSIGHNINSGKSIRALPPLLARMGLGIFYLPLLFRSKQKAYSRQDLGAMFTELKPKDFQIEEYPVYNDFIVYGRK